nr:hypothetical protein [Bradyrhizobium sp. SRL28]
MLALARIGVGESGGTPASQSIIADLFSKNERPRALGVYAIGTYAGTFTTLGPVVHLGGTVDTRRYPTGELIRRPSLCRFDPSPRPAARIAAGQTTCM